MSFAPFSNDELSSVYIKTDFSFTGASNELVMRIPRSILVAIHNLTDYGEIIDGQSITFEKGHRNVTYYSVCCREDKQLLVDLPHSGGMYLPKGSSVCSSIPGTYIEHEHVSYYLNPYLKLLGSYGLN